MAEQNALQPQPERAVPAPAPQQQQPARPVVIDAEFSEVTAEDKQPSAASAAQPQGPKLGEGAFAAWARMGLKELAQILPAFPDSVRPIEEPGALGNVTPQIATDQMGYGPMSDSAHRGQFQSQEQDRGLSR
jgi:hypothetical protein